MNRSTQRQRHEKARKQHRHDLQEYVRERARAPRPRFPLYVLAVGVALMLALVIGATFWQ